MQRFISGPYRRLLRPALRYRYATLALALAMLMLTVGLFAGGYIKTIFMPEVEGDVVHAKLTMPFGTPATKTKAHIERMQADRRAAGQASTTPEHAGGADDPAQHLHHGGRPHRAGRSVGSGSPHLGEVAVYLKESDQRNVRLRGLRPPLARGHRRDPRRREAASFEPS